MYLICLLIWLFILQLNIFAASQHSGVIEEDFGSAHDLLHNKSDLNISTDAGVDGDSEDEGRIEFQCPDCERLCADLEQ